MVYVAAGCAFIVWLVLNGMLWWLRPSNEFWLVGSMAIFAVVVAVMMWYLTRSVG